LGSFRLTGIGFVPARPDWVRSGPGDRVRPGVAELGSFRSGRSDSSRRTETSDISIGLQVVSSRGRVMEGAFRVVRIDRAMRGMIAFDVSRLDMFANPGRS
jgi:hypothetical protein